MTDTPPPDRDTPETAAPPRRRWLWPLLMVSLALNLMVVGAVAGWLFEHGPRRGGPEPDPARGVMGAPFVAALDPTDRHALFADLMRDRTKLRENRAALRARFDALLSALRADPFDPAEVQRLFDEQSAVAVNRQKIGEDLLIERLAGMSAEARAAYADRLEKSLKRFNRSRE